MVRRRWRRTLTSPNSDPRTRSRRTSRCRRARWRPSFRLRVMMRSSGCAGPVPKGTGRQDIRPRSCGFRVAVTVRSAAVRQAGRPRGPWRPNLLRRIVESAVAVAADEGEMTGDAIRSDANAARDDDLPACHSGDAQAHADVTTSCRTPRSSAESAAVRGVSGWVRWQDLRPLLPDDPKVRLLE